MARGLSKHGHRVEANASARMRLSGGMCASLCGSVYGQAPARICAIHARSSGNARVSLRRHASGCIRLRDRDTCGHNARSWAEAGEYTCVCVAGDAQVARHTRRHTCDHANYAHAMSYMLIVRVRITRVREKTWILATEDGYGHTSCMILGNLG